MNMTFQQITMLIVAIAQIDANYMEPEMNKTAVQNTDVILPCTIMAGRNTKVSQVGGLPRLWVNCENCHLILCGCFSSYTAWNSVQFEVKNTVDHFCSV